MFSPHRVGVGKHSQILLWPFVHMRAFLHMLLHICCRLCTLTTLLRFWKHSCYSILMLLDSLPITLCFLQLYFPWRHKIAFKMRFFILQTGTRFKVCLLQCCG